MTRFITMKQDRRSLHEIIPDEGRKCFIADLPSARQCGYGENERVYRVANPLHGATQET